MAAAPYWVTNLIPLGIDPISLGPFIYLNAKTGLVGAPDGSAIALWPDESGNGHNGAQGVVAQQPVMERVGSFTSANGGPAVHFLGKDATPSNIGGVLAPSNPSVATGYDLLFYGRFYVPPVGNAFAGSVLFQDDLGGAPQIGYYADNTQVSPGTYLERDAGGTHLGSLFSPGGLPGTVGAYGLMRWKFVPATATTGMLTASINGTTVLTCPYSFDPTLSHAWGIGSNQVQNVSCLMDLCAFAWYTKVLADPQVAGIQAFFRSQFG